MDRTDAKFQIRQPHVEHGFPEAEVIRTHPLSRFAWRFSLEFLIRRRVSQGRGGLDGAGLAKWDASMATFGSTDVSS